MDERPERYGVGMSDSLIIPIVQTTTRHHLAIENAAEGIASVEVVYNEEEYGRLLRVIVSPDVDDLRITFEVKS